MEIAIALVVGMFFGFTVAWMLYKTNKDGDTEFIENLVNEKNKNLKKLLKYFEKNSRVTNNDVENLLRVSNSTAYRYLEELEDRREIRQIGKTGAGVYYEKI